MKSIESNPSLKRDLKVLNISFNKIGDQGMSSIISYINSGDCSLEDINVEGNSLGDSNIRKFCDSLNISLNSKLISLNISRNLISNDSCPNIASLLEKCPILKTLMISWNQIKNQGASLIINKLKKNIEMKVFDISWNSIGSNLNSQPQIEDVVKGAKANRNFMNFETNEFRTSMNVVFRKELIPKDLNNDKKNGNNNKKDSKPANVQNFNPFPNISSNKIITPFARELGEYFKDTHSELVHLDFSHNNICSDDAVYLSQECKANHRILGMHVDGNEMNIDELGFLHPMKKTGKEENYFANSQIYYDINKDQNFVKTNNDKVKKIRAKNNCWICEGWRETTFIYRPEKIKDIERLFVKIHLSFENWKPYDMIQMESGFKCIRMCPPGEVLYFFTVNQKLIDSYGVNSFNPREHIVYAFEDEFIKEFHEHEIKHEFLAKQNEQENKENADDLEKEEFDRSMSDNSNVTQVMEDMNDVYFYNKFFFILI